MVAKTLDEKKPKKSLRNEFASFQTSSILFNSTYLVGEIFLGSVESNCAQVPPPPPPGPLRGICVPCQSLAWRGALANFAFGRAFAFPASTPLVTNKAKKSRLIDKFTPKNTRRHQRYVSFIYFIENLVKYNDILRLQTSVLLLIQRLNCPRV